MTTPTPATTSTFADPASGPRLARTAAALTAHGFAVEIVDDAAAARDRVEDLIPDGATVLTGASETLRLSGIDEDINASGRYASVRTRGWNLDRVRDADEVRRLLASPDVAIGSANAVTETGALVFASASGSQLPATRAAPPARSGSSARRRSSPTSTPRCGGSTSTCCRSRAPGSRKSTAGRARSTGC